MPADQYRRRASEAHQRGEQASDLSVKARWERLAHEWLTLAEQVELFERRYPNPDPAEPVPHPIAGRRPTATADSTQEGR